LRRRAHHLHLCAAAPIIFFAPPRQSSSSHRRAYHLLSTTALIIFIFAPPCSSSSSLRRRAHHLHLRAAAPIIFIFAPRPSSSSSRRRAHHLHLCAAAPIIFFVPLRSSSSSSCRHDHHASNPRSSFVWWLGLVNSIHPRRHLFIRLTARGNSIAAMPFLHSASSVTALLSLHLFDWCIDHRATIFSAGRPISLPRHNLFSGPANLIAVPQSLQWGGESHCHAAIISAGR